MQERMVTVVHVIEPTENLLKTGASDAVQRSKKPRHPDHHLCIHPAGTSENKSMRCQTVPQRRVRRTSKDRW